MRFGRVPEPGFLPVYSVDTEAEARKLLGMACKRNDDGEYFAPELAQEQTIDRLFQFGERLAELHERMITNDNR